MIAPPVRNFDGLISTDVVTVSAKKSVASVSNLISWKENQSNRWEA